MDVQQQFAQASIKTADNLRSIAYSPSMRQLSQLSLPEVDAAVDVIARLVPAGNVPGVILNGLARLSGRRPPAATVTRDINLLFKGVESALDKAVYGAFFAGPAAIIWGYQNILKIAGKDPDHAFPDGLWQFYTEYALREDTARHANETKGFDSLLQQHHIELHPVDRMTAWVMASIHMLHQYPDLLANEWRERVYLSTLQEATPVTPQYANLYREWEKKRPFGRGHDADPNHNFAAYRRHKFDQYLAEVTQNLSPEAYQTWTVELQTRRQELKDYQQQLSIWSTLQPGPYGEEQQPLAWESLCVGLVVKGRYYLIPVCASGSRRPVDVTTVREQIGAIHDLPTGTTAVKFSDLALIKRSALADLRRNLNKTLATSLERLQHAPIIFNADQRPVQLTLPEIRQAERGLGDHALTLFDTGETMVFDQSHIYFDGMWGASLAEIFTREAMSWAVYLAQIPEKPQAGTDTFVKPLTFPLESTEQRFIEQAPRIMPEVSVETDGVNLQMLLTTRKLFKQRSRLLNLTINDLLILFRALHAVTYQPHPNLIAEVETLAQIPRNKKLAELVMTSFDNGREVNPAIMIPMDASRYTPKERLYPLVFEAPLRELDLLGLHQQTLAALAAYKQGGDFDTFNERQRTYLAALVGFSQVFQRAKEIGMRGESASSGSIKLLANMPTPVQHLLDAVPGRFDVLNDLIKGREVFSNLGQAMPGSSLSRFSTAKDDNEKKSLAWGIITDTQGVMRITLRDFRPHVAALAEVGQKALAVKLAQHYLDTYAEGLDAYVRELRRIVVASRD